MIKGSVLIVDDNVQNIQFLGEILENNQYEVSVAKSGEQALEYLHKELPDLVLLDIMMPGKNGYDICTILKKNNYTKNIPVIFLTAKAEPEDIIKGFEVGAVDYITKPFRTPELLARVKVHIELKKAKAEIKTLRGIIPVCAGCKKIRDEKNNWLTMEQYMTSHTEAQFSHGLCPECMHDLYSEEEWYKKKNSPKDDKSS